MKKTLVLIKPHVFRNFDSFYDSFIRVIVDIQSRYLVLGLKIIAIKDFIITEEFLREFYCEHVDKDFFEIDIIPAMNNERCIAMVLEGENAISSVRSINGATNPAEALKGTIRNIYGVLEKGPNNAVHGSDSLESAEREIKIIFGSV